MESIEFTSKVDGADVGFEIKQETLEIQRKCDAEYSIAYTQAIRAGITPRSVLEKLLRDQGMWTDEDDTKLKMLQAEIAALEIQVAEANTADEGLPLAVRLGELRGDLVDITQQRGEVLNNSAEFMAEQVRRDAYVAYATVYKDTGKLVFKDYNDLVRRSDEQVSLDARKAIAQALYAELGEYLESLPEAAFRNVEAGLSGTDTEKEKVTTKKKATRKKRTTKKSS